MELKQICQEILEEAKKKNIKDLRQFNRIKLQVLDRLKYEKIPKNATIASIASDEDREIFKKILSMKPVRTISGVAPIALMTDPYPCPHTIKGIGPCTYCPGGPGSAFGDVPQSYTGKEPSTRRAIRNHYDPYLGVFNRLEHYVAMNSVPEKTEVILQGGTFPFSPHTYQDYFVKYLLKAMNDFSRLFYVNGNLDMNRFNLFFELPANLENKQRTKNIQQKLLFIKNLDLSNKNLLDAAVDLFFNNQNKGQKPMTNDAILINNKNNELITIKNNAKPINNKSNNNEKIINGNNNPIIIKNNKNQRIINKNLVNNNSNINEKTINNNIEKINNENQRFSSLKLKILNNDNNSNENLILKNNNELNNPIIINNNDKLNIESKINEKSNIANSNDVTDPNIVAMKTLIEKVNAQNNPDISLEQIQKENETARIRCVGLTIETKSDYGKLIHGNQMLRLGCTRVEIGIQSIYDEVLEKTNRDNTVQDNIDSIRILKDLGFKINAHYMPGLPYTTKEMDQKGLRELFSSPDYRPDMLKIYPCMVMPGTGLYDDWKNGKFTPLSTREAAELITEMKKYLPGWVRLMRVQRDIPSYLTSAGVDRTNLRQYVEKICMEKGIKCRCIRCREAGFNSINNKLKNNNINNSINKNNNDQINNNLKNLKIKIIEYEASHGKEFFIEAGDPKNDILFGYCRLRFPSQFLRKEITKDSALIRELHVYSLAVSIGKKSEDSFQHRGIGKKLMEKAEEIAVNNNKSKIVVISGIGAKEYFAKLGYGHDGPYMSKILD